MDAGVALVVPISALVGIPLTITVVYLLWRINTRVTRIEKMLLHTEYRAEPTERGGIKYVPEIRGEDTDPDVERIKQLRQERQRELREMGREEAMNND